MSGAIPLLPHASWRGQAQLYSCRIKQYFRRAKIKKKRLECLNISFKTIDGARPALFHIICYLGCSVVICVVLCIVCVSMCTATG
jgi:hypothetical protein